MADVFLMKLPSGALAPADQAAAEAIERIRSGSIVSAKITQPLNVRFHRKFFAMVAYLYDIWHETVEPISHKGQEVKPSRDRFRRDLIILSGRFDATYNVLGELRLEAKSISFASMDEIAFEELYSSVIDVALSKVLNGRGMTPEKVRAAVDRILAFD